MKLYCSKADVEKYTNQTITIDIDNWIEGISIYIKGITNRDWKADTVASARLYDGNGYQQLEVDDFIETPILKTGQEYGQSLVTRTDFILYPYNTTHKNTFILRDDSFEKGIQTVEVTAKWGYQVDVPEDIRYATTVLTSAVFLAQTNTEGEVESEKIGNYQVKYRSEKHKDDAERAMDIIESRKIILI